MATPASRARSRSKETVVGSADFRSTTRSSSSGDLDHEFTGRPVRGEGDVLQVCESLQEALGRRGVTMVGKFERSTEGGIDAVGHAADGLLLRVQVTGVIDQPTMAQLWREGRASSEKDVLELADEVCAAVQRKIDACYASTSEITLVLDAIRSPGHATSGVVAVLSTGPRMAVLRSSGFEAIWLVGATADHAYLLYEQPPCAPGHRVNVVPAVHPHMRQRRIRRRRRRRGVGPGATGRRA